MIDSKDITIEEESTWSKGSSDIEFEVQFSKFKKTTLRKYKGDKDKLREIVRITKSPRFHNYDTETTVVLSSNELEKILYTKPKKVVKKVQLTSGEKKWFVSRLEQGMFRYATTMAKAHADTNKVYDFNVFKFIVKEYEKAGVLRKDGGYYIVRKNKQKLIKEK